MKIRSKLAWTFILLLIFGITAISSYAILFIRNYMLNEGVDELRTDAAWMALTLKDLEPGPSGLPDLDELVQTTGYQLAVYDSAGQLLEVRPDSLRYSLAPGLSDSRLDTLSDHAGPLVIDRSDNPRILALVRLPQSLNDIRYLRISQFRERFYHPIKTIRWIIYYGMFISIGLVIVVSLWIARYITQPIMQIEEAARAIAGGDVDREIHLQRRDEFGALARSLNTMASKLRADNEELMHINERQRQFFADITHEIRNPLHTLIGAFDMLEMDQIDEGTRTRYIATARRQAERMNRLYKDLLTLQRYDTEKYQIEQETFDLAELMGHLKEQFGPDAVEKGLDLELENHSCPVVGDPGKIEQVLDNLLSNAIKYTSSGEVKLRYRELAEGKVEICVSDTGPGIAPEHQKRLFDRFYRTDKARSRDQGGTGLGLSIVQSILQGHGTSITVDSEVGKGSRFCFKLPRG